MIKLLTETPPSVQETTINRYFMPNASFTHPFCRTGSSSSSRYLIHRIYRWYKILSPKISVKIQSVSFDEKHNVLYVGLTQVFSIWAIPTHRAEVSLVTVLHLVRDTPDNPAHRRALDQGDGSDGLQERTKGKAEGGKWYISSQNDLYQTDQWIKFVLPWLAWIVPLWQLVATLVCVAASYAFAPVTWWEETRQRQFRRVEMPPLWDDAK